MYKSKYENLIEHLINEHDLILLDSEIQEIENWVDKDLKALSIGSVSGSSLSEAILIIENLMAYGNIYTIKGVRYVEGSHEEILDKAENWLNRVRKNYR